MNISCTKEKEKLPPLVKPQSVAQEVLAKFNAEVSEEKKKTLISKCKGTIIKHLGGVDVYHLKAENSAGELMSCLKKFSEIKYVEPNRIYRIPEPPPSN
ncbi:hypothetical protein ACFLRA_01345 [Bdellovibrionota bacterium]